MATRYDVDLRITRLLLQVGLMCARLGQFADAQQIIGAVKAFRDDLPHPGSALALSLLYQGRYADAQAELEQVLRNYPDHQLAKALLGLVYREIGRTDWRDVLQEVVEDGRDEWAMGLAEKSLQSDDPVSSMLAVDAIPRDDEAIDCTPHSQRLYV
jgi:tetratricopeptide (TPR) repeat protein